MSILSWFGLGGSKPVLDKSEFRPFKLVEKEQLSHNTAKYRFALPSETDELNLPIGQHISVRTTLPDGKEVMRSYTPTSLPSEKGHFDLVIKTYPDGVLSKMFANLAIGDTIEVRGPKGNFTYTKNMCKSFGMIAGGTGKLKLY
jgi:cytochrome-b5 reductase